MAERDGEKTIEPTPHRRQQARAQGRVAKSQDLSSAVLLVAGLLLLLALGGGLVDFLADYCRHQLGGEAWLSTNPETIAAEGNRLLGALARHLLPILGLLFLTAVSIHLGQSGFLFLPGRATPDLSRLDPAQGLRRIFAPANSMRLALGLLKIAVIGGVALACLAREQTTLLGLGALTVPQIAAAASRILLWTSLKIGGALLVLAILDYGFQRWQFERSLRMTPQELREEMKELEGQPETAARRRRAMAETASGRRAGDSASETPGKR